MVSSYLPNNLIHFLYISSDVVLGLGAWLYLRTKLQSLVRALALKVKSSVLTLASNDSLVLGEVLVYDTGVLQL